MSRVLTLVHELDWRLNGIIACIFLTTLLFLFSGLTVGVTAFFELALMIEFTGILLLAVPIAHPPSKLRALFEWTVIGLVWIMIVMVVLWILTLR